MKREWKPGDVAIARLDTETEIRVMWTKDGWRGPEGTFYDLHQSARPLVVIDPENREQVDYLCIALVEAMHRAGDVASAANGVHPATVITALREFANPTPPKPEEPTGLGAVVEDAEGEKWMRGSTMRGLKPWVNDGALDSEWRAYRGISAVRVLSEGVQA